MEKLRIFLKKLTPREQALFSIKCGTTIAYIKKAMSLKSALGAAICVQIEINSNHQVTRKDLRPSDWHLIWPELVK